MASVGHLVDGGLLFLWIYIDLKGYFEIIKVNKILAASYYGEAVGENVKFVGTTIAYVEG